VKTEYVSLLSVHLSTQNNLTPTWQILIFIKICQQNSILVKYGRK
jgi:hypothetical protein